MIRFRNQAGVTLIELLIATGISTAILGGLAAGIFAIMSVTGRGNDEIAALKDIQSASFWINRDARMARQAVTGGGSPADNVTLSWNDSSGGSHTSKYTFTGSELQRKYDGELTTVAWNLSSVEFSLSGDMLTYTFISSLSGRWNVSRETTGRVNLRAFP